MFHLKESVPSSPGLSRPIQTNSLNPLKNVLLALLLILILPVLALSQSKKKIFILEMTDLSTENSHKSLSKAIPDILKTQLESERLIRDFNSKDSYYFYTRKELRRGMKKAKVKKKDFQDSQKIIKLGWILKADLVIIGSYRITGDKVEVQLKVLSVKEERTVLTYTSKALADPYVALDLFMIKHYSTIEKISNLPPTDPSKLLILDLADESGVSNYRYLSKRIPEIIKDNLLDTRDYNIVSRSRFLKVMKRRKFDNSDLKEKKNVLSIARELGAVIVIYGTYKKQGDEVIVSIHVVDVETGKVLYEYRDDNALGQKELNKLTQNFIAGESKRPKSVFKTIPKPPPGPPFIPSRFGLRVGYPFLFATLGDRSKTQIPYISIFWRVDYLVRTCFMN
ncbi:MAG: hypothetical protein IEMM0008_1502 [bacterium]|nr:MAG: hypothetical protein IEMM0008_1502 [bacterium]